MRKLSYPRSMHRAHADKYVVWDNEQYGAEDI